MADAVEIPETSDRFGRKVALCIAMMAVVLAFISTKGDNAKGDGLLAATKASGAWSYYQAKSIKEHSYLLQKELVAVLPAQAENQERVAALLTSYGQNIEKYGREKQEIMDEAKKYEGEITSNGAINDRCDNAGLLLQIAIVISSIAILVHWPLLWVISLLMGAAGTAVGATAFFM